MARKPMLGHKMRRLRRAQGLTQAAMADRLGISPSYLNLIEGNQRPVTVDLLLKVAQGFDLDLQSFAEDDAARLGTGLQEVFADPLIASPEIRRQDLTELAEAQPAVASAILKLYRAYRENPASGAAVPAALATTAAPAEGSAAFAEEEVREYLHARANHFPELEAAAEEIWASGELEQGRLFDGLTRFLDREFTVRVRIVPSDVLGGAWRRYDRHGRRVLLSEMLPPSSRIFQLGVQIAVFKHRALLDRIAGEAGFRSEASPRLARLALANYFAGAVVMPYDRLWRDATALRYDVEVLQNRFEAGFEQVCHRLTTLQRPGAKGVPFFMIRIDRAGNVSKRFGPASVGFARFGGACPRWNIHDAFQTPGRIAVQVSEMPDGQRFFSIARTVAKPGQGWRGPGPRYALALGCELAYAAQLVYGDGIDLSGERAVPIGIECRVCERLDCVDRAAPPANHRLIVDETTRGPLAFTFQPLQG